MEQGILALRPGIRTFEITVPNPEVLTEELAFDADALLGYTGMRKALGIAGPLGRVLTELEIKPYDPADVEVYKEQTRLAKIDEIQAPMSEWERKSSHTWSSVGWVESPLAGYSGYVEPFALDLARSIKRKLPDVGFIVDALVVGRAACDPFLIAKRGEETFIIAVWDEPEFERSANQ